MICDMVYSNCIAYQNGKILFEDEDITNRWVEYFGELYNDDKR